MPPDDAADAPVHSQYRRAHFRLPYPPDARPAYRTPGGVYAVVELSEVSARILPNGPVPVTGDVLDGTLVLPGGGGAHPVEGVAVRVADDEVVVWFTTGLRFKTIMDEQRRLTVTHPEFLPRPGRRAGEAGR